MEPMDCDKNKKESNRLLVKCLSNELVLRNLFGFLPIYDLKNVRLVSRLWRNVASPGLQQKAVVKLDENIHLQGDNLNKFLKDFASIPSAKVFFRNYRITLWNIDDDNDQQLAFWEKYGRSVESLEISWSRFVGVEIVRSVFFDWTPNKKRLALKDCNFYEMYDDGRPSLRIAPKVAEVDKSVTVNKYLETISFYASEPRTHPPISWHEIFLAYPNLENLLFYNLSPADTKKILDIANTFKKESTNSFRIKNLNIFNGDYATSEIPKDVNDSYLLLKLPLNQLSIDIGAHSNEYQIARILEGNRNVKKLTIYRGPLGTPMTKFPFEVTFPNLHSLEMTETVADCLKFVQYMPKLKSLALCEPPEVEPPFLPTDIVTKTEINFAKTPLPLHLANIRIDYDITCTDVRKLVTWFPYVKTAQIYLEDASFRTICGEWSQLEELNVLGDKVTEEGITGIKETLENGVIVKVQHPLNILKLIKLRKFVLKNYGMSTTISDLAVREGFLKMRYLNHLELCTTSITDEGWKLLAEMEQLKVLIPSDGRWQSNCDKYKKTFYRKPTYNQ